MYHGKCSLRGMANFISFFATWQVFFFNGTMAISLHLSWQREFMEHGQFSSFFYNLPNLVYVNFAVASFDTNLPWRVSCSYLNFQLFVFFRTQQTHHTKHGNSLIQISHVFYDEFAVCEKNLVFVSWQMKFTGHGKFYFFFCNVASFLF